MLGFIWAFPRGFVLVDMDTNEMQRISMERDLVFCVICIGRARSNRLSGRCSAVVTLSSFVEYNVKYTP